MTRLIKTVLLATAAAGVLAQPVPSPSAAPDLLLAPASTEQPGETIVPTAAASAQATLESPTTPESAAAEETASLLEGAVASTSGGAPAMSLSASAGNVLAPGFPGITYEQAIGAAVNAAPNAAAVTPSLLQEGNGVNTNNQVLGSLAEAAAMSALTADPAPLIAAGVEALAGLFGMSGGDGGQDSMAQFQQDVDARLEGISVHLDAIQTTLANVIQVDTQIQMDIQNEELNNLLTVMIASATVIDNAFQQFTTLAQAITSNTTVPATRQQAINNMYTLLTTDPNYGPNAVLTAVTNYQRYTLGFGGSQGLLAFVPMMVQNGWEACAMNTSAAPNLNARLLSPNYPNSDNWVYHDSAAFIFNQCLNQTYSTLTDQTGRAVQTVFGSILVEQLKAYTLLSAAYQNNTLYAPQLQNVAQAATAVGNAMANFWSQIAAPQQVDATAQRLFTLHAETLGADRQGQWWMQYENVIPADNPPFNPAPAWLASSLVTTMCTNANIGGGKPIPCLVAPSALDVSGGNGAQKVPATAFRYNRDGEIVRKSQQVLAPFCACKAKSCDAGMSNQVCAEDFGAGTYWDGDQAGDDKNGNTCLTGAVPMCATPDGKIEYIFDSSSLLHVPAPHVSLPQAPAFLQGIQAAFP